MMRALKYQRLAASDFKDIELGNLSLWQKLSFFAFKDS